MQFGDYRIYLPFPDGAIAYNCPQCGYRCCKGEGIGATPEEFTQLRDRYPTLAYFAAPRRDTTKRSLRLANFQPQCFFLGASGLCDIHANHGRHLKPVSCRSFPVNRYFVSGSLVVATLNFLCPLKRWSEDSGDERILHAQVIDDLARDLEVVLADAGTRSGNERVFDASLVDYEVWCRDLPIDDLLDLCSVFQLTAAAGANGATNARLPSANEISETRAELVRYRRAVIEVLGVGQWVGELPSPATAAIRPLCSHLRMLALHRFNWLSIEQGCELMGRLLCSLEIYLQLVAATNGCAITLATVDEVFSSHGHVLYVLAQLERVPTIDPLPEDEWTLDLGSSPEADAAGRMVRFIYDENDDKRWSFGRILGEFADPALRIGALRCLPVSALTRVRTSAIRPRR